MSIYKSILCLFQLSAIIGTTYADTVYTDVDFSSPISTIPVNTASGDVLINTSSAATITNTSGNSGMGINVTEGKTATLNNAADFTINAAWGIRTIGSSVELNGPGDIIINSITRGIFASQPSASLTSNSNININSSGNGGIGIFAYEGAQMTFNKEVTVITTGNNSHGIVVQKGNPNVIDPTIVFNDKVNIDIQGTGGTAVNAQVIPNYGATGGSIVFNDGLTAQTLSGNVIESTGGTSIDIHGTSTLIAKDHENSFAILSEEESTVSVIGQSLIKGDIAAFNGGSVNLNLDAGSTITGAIIKDASESSVNLEMRDSTWTMTNSSDVTTLDLTNSHVNFSNTAFSQLTTDTLRGNGTFTLKTNVVAGEGDKLIVKETSAGNHNLIINNQGSSTATGQEILTVVETADGTANFSLAHAVEVGGFEYGLQREGNNWQLSNTGEKTSAAQASISFLNSGYLMNYISTQTLFQRMGDLKATNGQEGNFWIRGFAGKLNAFNSSKLHGFGMDYNGYQLGIDKLLPTSNGNLYLGAMVGYTHANPDYKKGTGTLKDYDFGLYGTYIDNTGLYVDAVAKYTYLRNRFSVADTAGNKVKGTAKNHGYSLSIETGKRFTINNSPIYLEPQAQLTYSYMDSSSVRSSNGLKVALNSYDSTIARGGLALGYQLNKAASNPTDIYLKSSFVKEFSGKTSYKFNQAKEKHSFRGRWVESALGINSQINGRHNVYGEISYADGNRFDKQQINLGYRYQF